MAKELGVSELEIQSLNLGENVILLDGDCQGILEKIHGMGYVMALTRNEHVVHERKGVYDNLSFYGGPHNMGVAVNPDIDLRMFMGKWKYALAVVMDRGKAGKLYGFQFFDAFGEAVHKIYSTPKSDVAAWKSIVEAHRADEQDPVVLTERQAPPKDPETPDADIDTDGFREAWRGLTDTHQFFGMLRKYGVSRTQGLRLAPAGMVTPVDRLAVETVLGRAAAEGLSIMCFVHSSGCIQIHSGPVNNLRWMGDWYNVLDPKFNLHLDTTAIDACYVVRKPTEDGMVTSLELFDAAGEMITYFFGARKPGKPELPGWTKILEDLAVESLAESK